MLKENAEKIKREISDAGYRNITILAATKTVSAAVINELPACGIHCAGENRVQELLAKFDDVKGIDWHFIGKLQRNKVKYIIDKVKLIHSLDGTMLADEIQRQAAKRGLDIEVLIEVNIGGESSKSGICEEEVFELAEYTKKLQNIRLAGLMSVLPIDAKEDLYAGMNSLFGKLRARYGENIRYLSMGMSGDYMTALKHGANIIRPGSILFGKRV